jgi:hypothetical protein
LAKKGVQMSDLSKLTKEEKAEKQNNSIDSINVVMYSYRNKDAIKTLENLMKKWSGKVFLFVHWHDQNGPNRHKLLEDLINSYDNSNGAYVYIPWDDIEGAVAYKDNRLKVTFGGRYHLTITPGTMVEQDWDLKLINFVQGKNIIVSGDKQVKIEKKDQFFIKKQLSDISDFTLTNFIDRNFIFGNVIMMKNSSLGEYHLPGWLKYYGEEEILSLQYFRDSIEIYAAPQDVVSIDGKTTLEDFNYHLTFSRYHNYNKALELFKNSSNNIVGEVDKKIIDNFCNFHNFDFRSLSFLPFNPNDVAYRRTDSKFDRHNGSRFIKDLKKVD